MSVNSISALPAVFVWDAATTGPSAIDTIIAVLLILAVMLVIAFWPHRDSGEDQESNEGGKDG